MADGGAARLCMGDARDFERAQECVDDAIAGSEIRGIAWDKRLKWKGILAKLPPLQIGKHGQLQEWLEDYEEAEPGHRHMSHLFALFPSDKITLEKTPELAKGAVPSLEGRPPHQGWHASGEPGGSSCSWAPRGGGARART